MQSLVCTYVLLLQGRKAYKRRHIICALQASVLSLNNVCKKKKNNVHRILLRVFCNIKNRQRERENF